MDCIRVAREGGTIAIAPEGNRTFSGKTGYINPAIAPLARKLGMPIAFLRIEGGYGVHPRWSDEVRRGKMRAYVSRVVEPSEYSGLTDGELTELIKGELSVNEGVIDAVFRARRPAEHLERAFYVCPVCQGLSRFRTEGELISCLACGTTVRYTERKELLGVGCDFPFRFTTEWYDYQCDFMNKFDTGAHVDTPIYTETASFSEVIPYKRKRILAREAGISLFGDRITVSIRGEDILTYPFDEVSAVSVLGKNKVNIYIGKRIYQIKGDKSLNALKYVNVYYRYKNLRKGDSNEQFLGL